MSNKMGVLLSKIFIVVSPILVISLLSLLALVSQNSDNLDRGVRLVKLMYDFDTPRQLIDGQSRLQNMLSEEEFARLTVDNESRIVNTYYKFHYSPSRVRVLAHSPGYVLYTLSNDYIDPETPWVCLYDVDTDLNRIVNVREYRLVNVELGGFAD